MRAPMSAVATIARVYVRRRWRALVGLGLLGGLVGGSVLAISVIARRTGTAYQRLEVATRVEDVRVEVYRGTEMAEEIAGFDPVRRSWVAGIGVASADIGKVTYLGLTFGPSRPPDLLRPVVVSGRAARDDVADEAVMLEPTAASLGVRAGDVLSLRFITADELTQFDTGFGEPDGPTINVRVTGLVRIPGGEESLTPLLGTPAFGARYGAEVTVAHHVSLSLRPRSRPDFDARLRQVLEKAGPTNASGEDTPVFQARYPSDAAAEVQTATRVLVGGLGVVAIAAGIAGLLALAQALTRQYGTTARDQAVERVLGLAPGERTAAHALPALLVAAIATTTAAAAGLAAGVAEPIGSLRRYEAHPGWAPNVAATVAGSLMTGAAVVLLAIVAARRAGRAQSPRHFRPSSVVAGLGTLGARPPLMLGVRLALERGRGPRPVPVRSSLVGAVVAVAGLVATATFGASLDRLVTTPARYGWPGDFVVSDVTDDVLGRLVAEPRVDSVAEMATTPAVRVAHRQEVALAVDVVGGKGRVEWPVTHGRLPVRADEVALGTRLARDIGRRAGDFVDVVDRDGQTNRMRVVGVGMWPQAGTERFGSGVVLTTEALARVAATGPFRHALVKVANSHREVVTAEFADGYDVFDRQMPADVDNLRQMRGIPLLLAAFLAVVGLTALVHTVTVATRQRARDLAVVRTLGFTPAQSRRAIAAMGATIALLGVVLGIPLGLAAGRLVWRLAAEGAAVAGDAIVPVMAIAVVGVATVAAGIAVTAWPAWRVVRPGAGAVLRSE